MATLPCPPVLDDWDNAPAIWECENSDTPRIRYRNLVLDHIPPQPPGTTRIRKHKFCTISTNVLCLNLSTKNRIGSNQIPADVDIYLPLEIAIAKWSLAEGDDTVERRKLVSKVWHLNPGEPTMGSEKDSRETRDLHKIDFSPQDTDNPFFKTDFKRIAAEINSFLPPNRTLFSRSILHIRQDLGSLKWLNQQIGYKMKPVRILSLEDLYVVLTRRLKPEVSSEVGLGFASYSLDQLDGYDPENQCNFHQFRRKQAGGETKFCALAVAVGCSKIVINDVNSITSD